MKGDNKMTWLDGVLAVPAIGVKTQIGFDNITNFESNVGKFAYRLEQEGEKFKIKKTEIWAYDIECDGGLMFKFSRISFVSSFKYRFIEKEQPGELPQMEVPNVLTYTELLEKTFGWINLMFDYFKNIPDLKYDRIGLVASANLEEKTTPPGVQKWMEYLGRPWRGSLLEVNVKTLSKLEEGENFSDRCHHQIEYLLNKVDEKGYNLTLDWQREFNRVKNFQEGDFRDTIEVCKNAALKYFDIFAQGDLNYE